MYNTDRLPEHILEDIRQNIPFGRDIPFSDNEINAKSNRELLEHWLNWKGMIGWAGSILDAVNAIYGTELH